MSMPNVFGINNTLKTMKLFLEEIENIYSFSLLYKK